MSEPVRIGFIGTGIVADMHADGVNACTDAELAGVWNRTRSRAEAKAGQYGCPVYDSPEQLVGDPGVDAVFVLTNLETHRQYADMALAADKHVLVEKPVGVDAVEVRALAQAAATAGLVCMPGHNYVYESSLHRTRRLISEGRLGRLVTVYVLYNIHHPESVAAQYPGVIRQVMTHHAYILLYLGGRPAALQATKATLGYERLTQENIAMVNLTMADGGLAHFSASFAADDHAAEPWTVLVKVIGTEGSTRYSYRDWVELRPGAVHSQTYSAYPESIANEIAHFVRCVRGQAEPLSSLADAADAQTIVEACERSADTGERVELTYG